MISSASTVHPLIPSLPPPFPPPPPPIVDAAVAVAVAVAAVAVAVAVAVVVVAVDGVVDVISGVKGRTWIRSRLRVS